jgi:hypothetical protein
MAQKPPDTFLKELCKALSPQRKPFTDRERKLADRLRPGLWETVTIIRSGDDHGGDKADGTASAREEAIRAKAIARVATDLQERLRPFGSRHTLGRLRDYANGWGTSIFDARDVLTMLIGEANRVAKTCSEQAPRRPPGPRPNLKRRNVSGYVAYLLTRVGVQPTTTKNGVYARVLGVVYEHAADTAGGTTVNVERDVRNALKDLRLLTPSRD